MQLVCLIIQKKKKGVCEMDGHQARWGAVKQLMVLSCYKLPK